MSISIPCPKCSTNLKIKDPSLLGKVGKCPRCQHRFELTQPQDEDEVQMELVEPPAPIVRKPDQNPRVGMGAQWIPDEQPSPSAPTVFASESPTVPIGGIESDPLAKMRRQRRKKSLAKTVMTWCIVAMVVAGGAWGWQTYGSALTQPVPAKQAAKKSGKAKVVANQPAEGKPSGDSIAQGTGDNEFGRPTQGLPIEMFWIPSGASIIFHLRPAELWKAGSLGEGEFIAALGPVGVWMAGAMKDFLMAEPQQIQELLVCLIPGQRGNPPDVAVVVRRTEEQKFKKSDLLDKFAGQAVETGPVKYYANQKWAMMLRPDLQTYAICPTSMAEEMIRSSDKYNPTSSGIEMLLSKTDKDLHFTALFVTTDLKIHGETIVPANALPLLQALTDWVANDDEAETVAISFHLTENKFFTQFLARNANGVKVHALAKSFQSLIGETPRRILELVKSMNPGQVGPRKVIGRLPAMTKVVQLGSKIQSGERYVSVTYEGPERAGANLALGTLLAWDESTRTKFNASGSPNGTGATAQNKKPLKDLLKSKIDVDFRRTPLEEAFNYIAGEAKFDIYVDGDALKAAGYTKNMPQTFKDDGIAASSALAKIISLGKYNQMCFSIDESKNLVTVTTLSKANDSKLTIYEMK